MSDEQAPEVALEAPPVRAPRKAAPHPAEATVAAWIDAHLRNSPFSRDTPAWNHLQAAIPHLIAKLKDI